MKVLSIMPSNSDIQANLFFIFFFFFCYSVTNMRSLLLPRKVAWQPGPGRGTELQAAVSYYGERKKIKGSFFSSRQSPLYALKKRNA